ncbi:MAG TPA: TRAP transporter small permease subunit [Bacteriovoracaceae bacterium]|nr:TRAP transporter small permease subunit [Bacteriovoracaceae bacterium]
MTKIILAFDDVLEKFSKWGLVSSLFIILILAVSSIVLRWMGSSPMWLEPLTRHLVFLSAFFGGSLATSKNVHIRVDLLSKLIEMTKSRALIWIHHNLLALFCFVTCAFLMKASYDFFIVEREFGAPAFLDIHSSWLVGIIPFGIGLIALRFFNLLILGLLNGVPSEHNRV